MSWNWSCTWSLWGNFWNSFFFFCGEISPGYCLGIFIIGLKSRISIRDDWYLCSLFRKQTKRVEKPFLAVLDFSEAGMLLQSGETESMFKLKKSPWRSLLWVCLKKKIKFSALFQIQNWDRLFSKLISSVDKHGINSKGRNLIKKLVLLGVNCSKTHSFNLLKEQKIWDKTLFSMNLTNIWR